MANTCYLSQALLVSANQVLCEPDRPVTSLILVVGMTVLLSELGKGKEFKSDGGSSNRPIPVLEFFVGLNSGFMGDISSDWSSRKLGQ